MRYRIIFLLFAVLVVTGCFLAGGCSKKKDISGTWKGKITLAETGKSLSDLEFFFNQKGEEITGTMVFTKPGAKLPLSGTLKSGNILLISPHTNGLAVSITGVLENREKITGEAVLNYDTPQLGKRQDKTVLVLTR